jgi:hypothetical protein
MTKKKRLVVYLSEEVHDHIMEVVTERVSVEKRFRGVISDVIEECAREHFQLPNKKSD